ncbi:MAG: hypothetical protein SVV80_08395 [Planctomycetota bacterium]|nr:hypothetical protein [Planctomycetota bacterium]
MRRIILLLTTAILGGCSGEYILTAPDAAVLAGQDAPLVVRLQRRELWRYAPPQTGAAVTFQLGEGSPQCARTDEAGYAALSIKAPGQPGQYNVALYHQDINGDSAKGAAAIYVLAPDKPIAVVDTDSLPRSDKQVAQAVGAIVRIQLTAQVIYVTKKYSGRPARARELLTGHGYPDGPVVPYSGTRRWWKRHRSGADAMEELHRRFPKLRWGITDDDDAAEAFANAGLKVLIIGREKVEIEDVERFGSWAEVKITSSE